MCRVWCWDIKKTVVVGSKKSLLHLWNNNWLSFYLPCITLSSSLLPLLLSSPSLKKKLKSADQSCPCGRLRQLHLCGWKLTRTRKRHEHNQRADLWDTTHLSTDLHILHYIIVLWYAVKWPVPFAHLIRLTKRWEYFLFPVFTHCSDHHHPVSGCESRQALQRFRKGLLRQWRRLLLHTWY